MTQISASKDYTATAPTGLQVDIPSVSQPVLDMGLVEDHVKPASADQSLLHYMVLGVQEHVERRIGRLLTRREVTAQWESVSNGVRLPYPPHGTVDTVVEIDAVSDEATLEEGDEYEVKGLEQKRIEVNAEFGLRVTYQAGYETVPPALKMQMLRDIADRYDKRDGVVAGESVTTLPQPSAYDQWRVLH